MARTILILGEGVRDVGREGDRDVPCPNEGDLPRLLRRLSVESSGPERFGYRAVAIAEYLRGGIPRGRGPTRRGGKSKDLRDAVIGSLRSSSDPLAVAAVIDATPVERDELEQDIARLREQCARERDDVPVLLGLAVPEIEAWLLADPDARRAAAGEAAARYSIAPDVEAIEDPKHVWSSLCGEAATPSGYTLEDFFDQQRASAWAAMRPHVVAHASRAFARFWSDAQRWLEHVFRR